MNDSIFRISLDIHEHGSQAVLKAKYEDTGRKLCISLRSGGTPYIIADGCYAAFKATKPDGKILYNACTIEDNEIIYEFTEQTCTAIGRSRCEIALYGSDDKLITSPRFALLVDGTIYPDGRVESTDEFSALTDLVGTTQKFIEDATEATGKANEATEGANVATQNATNATNAATQAATAASQAAQNASTATDNANAATGRANEATQAANDATSEANLAAENANEATANVVRIAKNAMVVGKVEGESVSMDDAVELSFVGCRIFGKTTPLNSLGDRGSICMSVCGKNLLKNTATTQTVNGIAFTVNNDGSVTVSGTATQETYFKLTEDLNINIGNYILSGNKPNNLYLRLADFTYNASGTFVRSFNDSGNGVNVDVTDASTKHSFQICVPAGATLAGATFYPMLRLASVADATYEHYKEEQTLTISTPNGLHEGDYIDCERGTKMLGGIETPLSAEEIAAYNALHTYRDNTTVTNDASAHMELEYVMDAKKYIDSVLSGTIHAATVE